MKFRLATAVAAAGTLLLAAVPTATAGTFVAPTPASAPVSVEHLAPNYQAEFAVTVKGAEVTFGGRDITADLTGKASLTVEPPTLGSLEGKATGTLSVSAEHPELGKVTLESEGTGTASFNSLQNPFPAKLELSASGTVTIENPGGGAQRDLAAAPLELTTKTPASLAGTLNEFPPKGAFTDLTNPVELVDGSGKAVASVNKFPVEVTS